MSQFIVNADGSVEQDKIFICDRLLNKHGELYPVDDLRTVMRFNQNDDVSFKIYKYNNGEENPFWDDIDNIQIILVEGKGYFEIAAPLTVEECAYKQVTGISLGEAETSQTKITLEINTETDFNIQENENPTKETYNQTILYNPNDPETSLLNIIFKHMPHYTIGYVDASVSCIQRSFSCDDQTVYDFLQTIAEELECIFIFDNFKREVNCYDLKEHCNRQSCITATDYRNVKDGVCQHCQSSDYITYGYGKDTGVFIDHNNLVESVTLTGDKDSVKNCFKIEGADDIINNMLGDRLMDGNYIWIFSPDQTSKMSAPLQRALIGHDALVKSYQNEYNTLWDRYNDCVDKILFYQSEMMPSLASSNTTARSVHEDVFGAGGKISYACKSSESQTPESVLKSVKTFAKQILPYEYEIELSLAGSSNSSISFSSHIWIKDAYKADKTQNDEYTASVSLSVKDGWRVYYNTSADNPVFTTDYFMYLKQQLEISLAKSDVSEEVISFDPQVSPSYDAENDPQNLSHIHYTKYCYNRLKSFRDAYESCSQIIAKHSEQISSDKDGILKYINTNGNQTSIYDDLLKKYYDRIAILDARMAYLEGRINTISNEKNAHENRIKEIKSICSMEKFLKNYNNGSYGDDLWIELCSFKREDTYRNDNYLGDGVKHEKIVKNVEGLIKRATEELERACEISYSINTTIGNLLTMPEFKSLWDDFNLGNWIHIQIDENIYKLRLISIAFDYSDLAHIAVEFSDVTKSNNQMTDLKSLFQQASSMATNFNSVTRQAEKGYLTNQEFNIMKEAGLDIANTTITNADNQDFVIDRYGLTGRIWNDVKNVFDDEQIRIINNLLCFTSDGWKHTRLALGKIYYYDTKDKCYKWAYGLNAEVLISRLIMSELLKIFNKSGTYTIDDNGFNIYCNDNRIEINAMAPSFTISKTANNQEHIYMHYSPADGLIIDGTGKFSGMVLVGQETGTHIKLDPEKPSMVIYDSSQKKNIFDFNSDGKGKLKIIGGIITSILQSEDYDPCHNGMCINLEDKFIEIYATKDEEILSYNLDNNNLLRIKKAEIGGWKIDDDLIYSMNNDKSSCIYLKSDPDNMQIASYKKTSDINNSFCSFLHDGKWSFGLYDNGGFVSSLGYTDISQCGIYARSEAGMNSSRGDKEYLLGVDTINDSVVVTGHSDSSPALRITNYGEGDALYCESSSTGSGNKAFHCKVYNGDNDIYYFSVFGEYGSTSSGGIPNKRLVFRADTHNPSGIEQACDKSALGTVTFPWNEIHATNINSTSDLKQKDVIGIMDKQESLDFINTLKPIKYTFKNSTSKRIHMGFGAQHVAQSAKELNMGDLALYGASVISDDGTEEYYHDGIDDSRLSWGLKYNEFEAPMVASIQALYEMVTEQGQIIHEKDKKIEQLKKQVDNLSDKFEKLEKILQKHGLS